MNYTFAVCSHETLLRQSLVASLERDIQVRCLAEVSSVEDASLTPSGADLLLLDVDGPEEISQLKLRARVGALRFRYVMLLTGAPGGYAAHLVWINGWHGLVHKSDALDAMQAAIDRVFEGGIWLSPNSAVSDRMDFYRVLSEREIELLREMAREEDQELVARTVGLSAATVRTHRRNIFRKLNVRTQAALVRFALRSGLLSARAFIRQ
jgi:DNA-binding NarL/FixJ family response regulator